MSFLRNVMHDLVVKRLWPLALVLAIALAAVPVLVSRGMDDSSPESSTPVAPGRSAPTSRAAVTVETASTSPRERAGKVRNPFKGPKVATPKPAQPTKDASSGSGAGTTPGGDAANGANAPAVTGGTPTGGTTGGSDTDTGPDKPASSGTSGGTVPTGYRVTLRLGELDALKTFTDVARLTALPSTGNPLLIFTGVLEDGKTVVFLPSADVQVEKESDVTCKPSNEDCESIELKAGQTIFFKLVSDESGTDYQLDLVRLTGKLATRASANATSTRHSQAGAAMLRAAHVEGRSSFQGASRYRWLPERGALVRTPSTNVARASANGAAAASPADALSGQPVWHWKLGA